VCVVVCCLLEKDEEKPNNTVEGSLLLMLSQHAVDLQRLYTFEEGTASFSFDNTR